MKDPLESVHLLLASVNGEANISTSKNSTKHQELEERPEPGSTLLRTVTACGLAGEGWASLILVLWGLLWWWGGVIEVACGDGNDVVVIC
jgi:hypothetical protein